MNETKLDELIATLPRDLAPARDLWPALEAQLPHPKPKRWPLASAASLLLASLLYWYWPATPALQLSALEQELLYQQALAERLATLQQVDSAFGDWQWQLQLWQQAVSQVRQALSFYPDDPGLQQQLASLYQQQLSYVDQLAMTSP